MTAATAAATQSPFLQSGMFVSGTDHAFAAVHHRRDPQAFGVHQTPHYLVAKYGQIRRGEHGDSELSASRILELLALRGSGILDELCGSYQLVVVDRRQRQLIVQNDRQATLPWFYSSGPGWWAFAPEAKCLLRAGLADAQIDPVAATIFLREGFLLPWQSIFKGVRRLPPAQRVQVDLHSGEGSVSSYWSLRFQTDKSMSIKGAADRLHGLMLDCHRREVAGAEGRYGLFLTGGLDSRGIAASLHAVDSQPAASLTWSGRAGVKHGDPDIAGMIARHYGFPHREVLLPPDGFAQHATEWAYTSELANDISGFMLAPPHVFNGLIPDSTRFMLVGDQLFGNGAAAASRPASIRMVLRSAGLEATWLRGCVHPDMDRSAGDLIDQAVDQAVGEGCHSERDVVDSLTYHVHRPGWSFSAGNSRDLAIPVRRPLLNDGIVDFVRTLPAAWRNDKLLYYRLLRRKLIRHRRFPRATGDALYDWPSEFRSRSATRNALQSALEGGILESSLWDGTIDKIRLRQLMDSYFSSEPGSASLRPTFVHHAVNIRRFIGGMTAAVPQLQSAAIRLRSRQPAVLAPTAIIRRLALLGMLSAHVEAGRFRPLS